MTIIMMGLLMDDFIWRALIAGTGVALIEGPIGCFIVWRRMAYFGATLAHAALLGVALGFLFEFNITLGIIFVSVAISFLLFGLQNQRQLATDTLLGILAHGSLATGLVVLAFMDNLRVDLMAYLFGDILAVTMRDLIWIYAGGIGCLFGLFSIWSRLLAMTVHEDLAKVEGVQVARIRLTYMLLIAIIVAVGMKIVGILLIVSLLIIPAATARRWVATPEQMAVFASVFGVLSVAGGVFGSIQWDTPTGPSIVLVATIFFFLSILLPGCRLSH
ncbi:MAG: iron chelate uptake ABC transporter family permease subunit [Rhodospirillales bacterium]